MSTFKVELVEIDKVNKHPNADKLDIVSLKDKDWTIVTQKDKYNTGDLVIYLPIDSLLPQKLEYALFPPGSKITLSNSRVKTIKLRGSISQGMIVDVESIKDIFPIAYSGIKKHKKAGLDLTLALEITKYEPPVKLSTNSSPFITSKKQTNPNFRKYTGIENAKNYSIVFTEGEDVSVTEKIHGTNFRAGYVPFHANTLYKKILQFLKLSPSNEFVYGSHNVQLQNKFFHIGYYGNTLGNVYAEAVIKYNLKHILKPGEVIYGEVYGDGIQKGYHYGCKSGERKLVLFDLMIDNNYTDTIKFRKWADERQLPIVPEIYRGPFSKEKILTLRDGSSILNSTQQIREGVVVKPLKEETTFIGRKILKFISDNYLLNNQDNETQAH